MSTIGELLAAIPPALDDIATLKREVEALMTTREELNAHIEDLTGRVASLVAAHTAGLDLSAEDAKVAALIEQVSAVLDPAPAEAPAEVAPETGVPVEPPGSTVTVA